MENIRNKEIAAVLAKDYSGQSKTVKTYRNGLEKRRKELESAGYSSNDAVKKAQEEWIFWFKQNY